MNSNILLIRRAIVKLIKQPSAPLMGFGMSLFFLIVYNAGIGGVGYLDIFEGKGYLSFLFPMTIISLAMERPRPVPPISLERALSTL